MDDILIENRECCSSIPGFKHGEGCVVARERCPAWLDPFPPSNDPQTNNAWYRFQVKDLWFLYGRHCVSIYYLWLGAEGWPSKFSVRTTRICRLKDTGNPFNKTIHEWDCGPDDLKYLDYNLRHPSADEIYETLRTRDP